MLLSVPRFLLLAHSVEIKAGLLSPNAPFLAKLQQFYGRERGSWRRFNSWNTHERKIAKVCGKASPFFLCGKNF